MSEKLPVERLVSAITDLPNQPDKNARWPTAKTVQRPMFVYNNLFWLLLSLVIALILGEAYLWAAIAAIPTVFTLVSWTTAHTFAEGYIEGQLHAIEDSISLTAELITQPEPVDPVSPAVWKSIPVAPKGSGYLYVIKFTTGTVKVGQTANPARRIAEHRRDAWAYSVNIVNLWISRPHSNYRENEVSLIASANAEEKHVRAKKEYFHGADFDQVVAAARNLAGGVGVHVQPL